MKGSKTQIILKIIGINLFVVALFLVLMEIGFRLTKTPFRMREVPVEGHFTHFDPDLGWSYIPNKSLTWEFGKDKRPVGLHFSREGIRVPYPNFIFDYDKPSVLFVGGSFTMGHGLFFEETFVGQFSQKEGVPLQVVNLGVQGFGTDQSFLQLQKFIKKFNVKWVVYTFINKHLERNGVCDRRMLYRKSRFPGTKPLFKLDKNKNLRLVSKPHLYKYHINSNVWDAAVIRLGTKMGFFPPDTRELTEVLLKEMKRISQEQGAQFTVVNWYREEEAYNFIQNIEGVDVIGTKEVMPDWEEYRILGDGHPNQEAHKIVADLIYDYFMKNYSKIIGKQ